MPDMSICYSNINTSSRIAYPQIPSDLEKVTEHLFVHTLKNRYGESVPYYLSSNTIRFAKGDGTTIRTHFEKLVWTVRVNTPDPYVSGEDDKDTLMGTH